MKLSFKQKMIGQMLAVGLIPVILVAGYNSYQSYKQIMHSTELEFSAVRDMINERTEDYFDTVGANLNTLSHDTKISDMVLAMGQAISKDDILQNPFNEEAYKARFEYQKKNTPDATDADMNSWMQTDPKLRTLQDIFISSNPEKIGEKNKLYTAKGNGDYIRLHNGIHAGFNEYVNSFGYYDVFLVDAATGRVVYSVFKEIDFLSSVTEGFVAESGLGRAARKALASHDAGSYIVEDFSTYAPSYNDPALFAAAPIIRDGKTIGAVVFQLPPVRIQGMFSGIHTLGETAEGFFFGTDYKLRSDAVNPASVGMKVGFSIPQRLQSTLEPIWKNEPMTLSYTSSVGKQVLSAVRKVNVPGVEWGMLVRVNNEEVLKPVYEMLWITGVALLVVVVLVSALGYWLGEITVRPILRLANSFAVSAEKVARASNEVGEAVSSMVAAAEETSAQTVVIRRNSTEASGYVSSVSTSVEELNISINDISQSIGETNMVIDDAVQKAAHTDEVVRKLGASAQKITEVVSLINTLAEQTNLLALNAAIEAARAGDAGRGFAVVADEVKKLASNTSNATVDIGEQVKEIKEVAEQSVSALQAVVKAIHKIRDNATTVSAAVEEQSGTAKTIAASVRDAAGRVQQVDDNMTGIEQAAHDTGVASDQVNSASGEVSTAFNTLKTEVGQVLDDMGIRR